MPKPLMSQRDRERALFRYRNALLRADFDTVASVLHLAEQDAVLWQMLHELDEEDDALQESDIRDATLLDILPFTPSSNGTSPKTYVQEDKIMTIAIPNQARKTSNRFGRSIAAVLMLLIFGAMLLIEISLPTGNNFGQVVELTQQPLKAGCQLTTTATANEESLRLAEASTEVRKAHEPDTELALLLGICALQTAYTQEGDNSLQQAFVAAGIVPEFPAPSLSYNGAQLSPDGRYLLAADTGNGAHLWDVASRADMHLFPNNGFNDISSVAFSSDGRYVLTTIEHSIARLWDVETGAGIRDFNAGIEIGSIAISPDGTQLALGLSDGQVQLWDIATGILINTIAAHHNGVGYVAFSPDSTKLLISGNGAGDYVLQLWDVEAGLKIREFPELKEPQGGIFSPDGHYVIAGGRPTDPRAVMWDAETGAEIRTFLDLSGTGGFTHVQAFAFSPDGRYVLIGSANQTVKLYEVETGVEVRSFNNNPFYVLMVAFSPDGKRFVIRSNVARIWSTDYRDMIADACRGLSRDFTAEEQALYGLREAVPTCPQFAVGYALEGGMTAIPTHPVPVWTPLPTMESTGE